MDARLLELRLSHERLRRIVDDLTPDRLTARAYPSRWTIAEVLSHIGSGAVIFRRRLEDTAAGRDMPDDFAPTVWDEWNAKSPGERAAAVLPCDRALVESFEALPAAGWTDLRFALGPLELDAGEFVGVRLNEHVLHTWDLAVAEDPTATLPPDATALVVDALERVAGFSARSAGVDGTVVVATTEPTRTFAITTAGDTVTFTRLADAAGATPPADVTTPADLTMVAEAFVRLIYGRLDPDHTPAVGGDPALLDRLRTTFPGL